MHLKVRRADIGVLFLQFYIWLIYNADVNKLASRPLMASNPNDLLWLAAQTTFYALMALISHK